MEKIYVELRKLFILRKNYLGMPIKDVQNKIVDEIKEELSIVEQNKRLIQIFEQKIKDKINEVWGSETK